MKSLEATLAESLALLPDEMKRRMRRNARRRRQRKKDRAPLVTAYWKTEAKRKREGG